MAAALGGPLALAARLTATWSVAEMKKPDVNRRGMGAGEEAGTIRAGRLNGPNEGGRGAKDGLYCWV